MYRHTSPGYKSIKIKSGQGYMQKNSVPAWELSYGGQQGWGANIREFLSNQAYVSRPLVCVVLKTPLIFNHLNNADLYHRSLKALMETHSTTITGFDATLSADFDSHGVSGAGAIQEEVIDVTRAQPTPTHTFVEKYGRPVNHLLDIWMRFGMMDPETKHPMASIIAASRGSKLTDMGPDLYTATCLYFEPDPLFRYVDKAWLVTNMMPKTGGEITAQRDLRSAQQIITHSVEFTALAQYGAGVNEFAKTILDSIHQVNADPFTLKSAMDKIDESLANNKFENGSYYGTWFQQEKDRVKDAQVGLNP